MTGESLYNKGEAFQCGLSLELMLHPKVLHRHNGEGLRLVILNEGDKHVRQIDMPKECAGFSTVEFDLWDLPIPNEFKRLTEDE